jgi:hypothetical protein
LVVERGRNQSQITNETGHNAKLAKSPAKRLLLPRRFASRATQMIEATNPTNASKIINGGADNSNPNGNLMELLGSRKNHLMSRIINIFWCVAA